MRSLLARAAALACATASPAFAQTVTAPAGRFVPLQGVGFGALGAAVTPVSPANPLPAADASNAAFASETALTVGGAAVAAGRSVKLLCPSDTTLTVTYAGGGSGSWAIAGSAYTQTLPLAVTGVSAASVACTSISSLN